MLSNAQGEKLATLMKLSSKLLSDMKLEGLVPDKKRRTVTAVSDETQRGIMDTIYKSSCARQKGTRRQNKKDD